MGEAPADGRRFRDRGTVLGFVAGAAVVLLVGTLVWTWFGLGLGPQSSPAAANLTSEERRGQQIYVANCQSCHGGSHGGDMMAYPPRHNATGHTWHHPDCELKQIVREGGDEMTDAMRQMMAPPDAPKMQAFKDRLTDDEISAVLAFIKTMWTPDEREIQAQVTKDGCATART